MNPTRYIALGDSISIDIYPAADAARRHAGKASTDRLGAASLFHRNDDRLWPEFRGRDLSAPSLLRQIDQIAKSDERSLITITIGGNDLLGLIGSRGGIAEIEQRVRVGVTRLLELRASSTIIITTVYDPSDGTNRLPGYGGSLDQEAKWLREYNERPHRSRKGAVVSARVDHRAERARCERSAADVVGGAEGLVERRVSSPAERRRRAVASLVVKRAGEDTRASIGLSVAKD